MKRHDGRKENEMREIKAEVGVVPNANGSAIFKFGDTVAIAAVYGPHPLHPQHLQDPRKGILRCNYDMTSFSVTERKRPGPSRRSQEISKVSEWSLLPVLKLEEFPNTVVDLHIVIIQANASTRCAGINAASLALAQAGVPMTGLVGAVSVGKLDRDIVVDVDKKEEDFDKGEGATDIAMAFTAEGEITLLQLDGKIQEDKMKEALEAGEKACMEIIEIQKKALKSIKK